jgi:hypothetical protein
VRGKAVSEVGGQMVARRNPLRAITVFSLDLITGIPHPGWV